MPKEQEPGMEKENAETKEVLFFSVTVSAAGLVEMSKEVRKARQVMRGNGTNFETASMALKITVCDYVYSCK